MIPVQDISEGLSQKPNGIWYGDIDSQVAYPPDGNDACAGVEDVSFWFRHRNACISTLVQNHPPETGGTIFDIGGGNGFVARGLQDSGFNVVLIEPGESGCLRAKARGVNQVVCSTLGGARFSEGSLDSVGLFDVIEHIGDDVDFLLAVRELTKPGGMLYLTVPAYSWLWSHKDIYAEHYRRYTLEGISRLLASTGFSVTYASYIFQWLPLPQLIFRVLPYRFGLTSMFRRHNSRAVEHGTRASSAVTKLISAALRGELSKISGGQSIPIGGSVIAAARRSHERLAPDNR